MKPRWQKGAPEEVKELGARIAEWRKTREKKTTMPEELWEATTRAGTKFGVYRVSRALRVSYDSLKSRVEMASGSGEETGVRFVELPPAAAVASLGKGTTELELTDGAGRTLRLRLDGVGAGEVVGLAERLWRGMP